jgi:hypothetical protein
MKTNLLRSVSRGRSSAGCSGRGSSEAEKILTAK